MLLSCYVLRVTGCVKLVRYNPEFVELESGLRGKKPVIDCNCNVISLRTERQGVHKNSFRNARGTWKCWFLRRGINRSTR